MSESFYKSGFGGLKDEDLRREAMSMFGPFRFWLKQGESCELAFVDDEPACIYEHQPKINGELQNFTCLKDVYPEEPVCCEKFGFDSRYYVGLFTIVDFRKREDKKGVSHQFELKLLAAKYSALKLMGERKANKDNRLAGRVYKVKRVGEKAPNIGDFWDYDRDLAADKADKFFEAVMYKGKRLPEWYASENEEDQLRLKKTFALRTADGQIVPKVVPFNYQEILKPKTPKILRDMLQGSRIEKGFANSGSGKSSGGGEGGKEDDVSF
jgi:hypothetical protein